MKLKPAHQEQYDLIYQYSPTSAKRYAELVLSPTYWDTHGRKLNQKSTPSEGDSPDRI